MSEGRARPLDLHGATCLELVAQVEQQLRHLRPRVELHLDAGKDAAAVPDGARLSGAAVGMALGDQLDGAERQVLLGGVHALTLADAC